MNYWLVKSDPEAYSWNDFLRDKSTSWDGVRNYQARNNLNLMKVNDLVLVYHSQVDKSIVGISKVKKTAYPDPTIDDIRWVSVELEIVESLNTPLTLLQIKSNPKLQNIALIKQSRLSVMPLSKEEYKTIIELSK